MRTIYVAGPMRGVPGYNFPAFASTARYLRAEGWRVVSPAELDEADGFDPRSYESSTTDERRAIRVRVMQRDLDAIKTCDAIALLPGWESSLGAQVERAFARFVGLDVYLRSEGGIVLWERGGI